MILIFVYFYILWQELLFSAITFKDGFLAVFQIFNPKFLKQCFHKGYARFIFWLGVVLVIFSGIDYKLEAIQNIKSIVIIFIVLFFLNIFSLFISLVLFPIASFMAKELVED
jgi:hypothetical protein